MIALVMVIVLAAFFQFVFLHSSYYQNCILPAKRLSGLKGTYDFVNLGSTFARYDFDCEGTGIKAANLALQSQYFDQDYCVLRHFARYLNIGCVVVIPIVPAVFMKAFDLRTVYLDKYYFVLDEEEIEGYSSLRKFFLYSPVSFLSNLRETYMSVKKLLQRSELSEQSAKRSIHEMAAKRVQSWEEEFKISRVSGEGLPRDLSYTFSQARKNLSKIIDYAVEHEFKPVIVLLPLAKDETDLLSAEFLDIGVYQNIEKANHRHIPVLNYINEPRLSYGNLYLNADCLNGQGRKIFMNLLLNDLDKIGYCDGFKKSETDIAVKI